MPVKPPHSRLRCWLAVFFWLFGFHGVALALGEPDFVTTRPSPGAFPLLDQTPAVIVVETNDWPGVVRAANDLAADVQRVSGARPPLLHDLTGTNRRVVIIGTLGKSRLLERLIREKKIDVSGLAGQWEKFFLQVVPLPFAGVDQALVICGSDQRGAIYGIYDLSEQIGVSPWYWWADVPPPHHDRLFVKAGKFAQGPPAVKYRGIFLNDEAPDLTGWVREKYGEVPDRPGVANYGRGFYTNLFELMLRLRANCLWPAMWNNAFNEDDPANPRLANEYGIIIGTSHQEPMLRAQKEWDRGPGRTYGNWNYDDPRQRPALQNFWRAGIRRNRAYASLVTLGLRAENDSGVALGKTLTEKVIAAQRQILAEEMNPDLSQIPQVWCLYKEVMGYYQEGLTVPDDVTLLWPDDNWGNLRRLPTSAERRRAGGAGIYYHFDYHGGPRSYQWINTDPIPKIWDQMSLAQEYGADRLWMVNVGHLKGYELPMEFFLRLAWNPQRWTNKNLDEFTRLWAAREFGPAHAPAITRLVAAYTRYNGRCKPELLAPDTYSLLNYREFATVAGDYAALAAQAENINAQLPPARRDAFYELVLFPIEACAELNAMYFAAAKNALYAAQGRASANDYAAQTRALFAAQTNLMDHFNHVFAGGKWNHFMDQPYIGYQSWHEPEQNNLDAVPLREIAVPAAAALGVAVEGATNITGGALAFDKFGQAARFIDVFNRGKTGFAYTAAASSPWIKLSAVSGQIEKEQRLVVGIDWTTAPAGSGEGTIRVSGAGTNYTVSVRAFNPVLPALAAWLGFIEADGYVSMAAAHYTRNLDAGDNRWIKIPGYGNSGSGMRATAPPDALATPGQDSPRLEYRMYLFHAGALPVEVMAGPTLNFIPGRPLRFALSFDDETPRIVTLVPADFDAHNGNQAWETAVKDNCWRVATPLRVARPGPHTLKIWMIDPAVVLEKIIINTGGVQPSYLGPPERFRRPVPANN